MAADAAAHGIRREDTKGTIAMVGAEPHASYNRPPLSKALWKGDDETTIWRGTADLGVDLRLGRTVVALDLAARRATDDRGDTYTYERVLLATGGSPRRLPFGEDVIYYRTLDDYRRYGDGYWRPHALHMINRQTGKSTDLLYSDYRFGLGFREIDFDKGVLSRVR